MPRPSFDEVAFNIARDVAKRSTCPRLHTGAVIVTADNRVLATGYNGSLPGTPHCDASETGCLLIEGHCRRTMHAEANAIVQAAKYGIPIYACKMYSLHRPCLACTQLIIACGLSLIVAESYRNAEVDQYLHQLGYDRATFELDHD
jgi:Deoxycytidylate deaminase